MLITAAVLGLLTTAGAVTSWTPLALTLLLGLGAPMNAPAWQAITPDLVLRSELPAAVALSGVAMNVARAVGPALGGLIVAAAGTGAVFLLNAASFVGVMVVPYRWHPAPRQSALPWRIVRQRCAPTPFTSAIRRPSSPTSWPNICQNRQHGGETGCGIMGVSLRGRQSNGGSQCPTTSRALQRYRTATVRANTGEAAV
jgi:MFS family permease